MVHQRKNTTRRIWLETLEKHCKDLHDPVSDAHWSPSLDAAPRDALIAIQNDKLKALTPFLYENSDFYRRRFERLGLIPDDIQTIDELHKWPVIDKKEMMEDTLAHPPYGTFTTIDDEIWKDHGWMMFSSSGSTGVARVFRYSHIDRKYWEWANARSLFAMGIRRGDVVFPMGGFGPHVFLWGVLYAFARMNIAVIPGGGMDGMARARIIDRFKPTVIACTPSYALHVGRTMQNEGMDPEKSSIRTVLVGGEPCIGIDKSRERLEDLWGARVVEFYGCTEVAPHTGGYSCPDSIRPGKPATAHLMEDIQIWELVDAEQHQPVPIGERGLTVCTSLNSESSPQLRFLVGDYTVFDDSTCGCGRTHVRAVGAFTGRADDIVNIRGIKLLPSDIEQVVRGIEGVSDEFEIVLSTNAEGMDIMDVSIEHPDLEAAEQLAATVSAEIQSRCEVKAGVTVLPPGTLPKTEFKAKRLRDERSPQD